MQRHERGRAAEDLALAYLALRGFRLLARGFRAGKAEVDLVMQDGTCVVMVEVKYRGAGARARGAESVSAAQRGRLERAAVVWLMRHGMADVRFDVVTVDEGPGGLRLEHCRGAFDSARHV